MAGDIALDQNYWRLHQAELDEGERRLLKSQKLLKPEKDVVTATVTLGGGKKITTSGSGVTLLTTTFGLAVGA
jgi:hypothetical protein